MSIVPSIDANITIFSLATGYKRNGCFMNISYSIYGSGLKSESSHCHPILCSIPGEYLQEQMKVVQDPDSEKYGRDVHMEYWCILEMYTYDFTCVYIIKPFELWRWQSQLPAWAPGTFGKSFCDCSLEKANVDGWIGHDWTLQVSFEDWEFRIKTSPISFAELQRFLVL